MYVSNESEVIIEHESENANGFFLNDITTAVTKNKENQEMLETTFSSCESLLLSKHSYIILLSNTKILDNSNTNN